MRKPAGFRRWPASIIYSGDLLRPAEPDQLFQAVKQATQPELEQGIEFQLNRLAHPAGEMWKRSSLYQRCHRRLAGVHPLLIVEPWSLRGIRLALHIGSGAAHTPGER